MVTISTDYGHYEQVHALKLSPQGLTEQQHIIKHNPNPNLIGIFKKRINIVYYTDTEKCFVYDENKIWVESLEKHDLKRLFSAIGHVLRLKKHPRRLSILYTIRKEKKET
jgi:ABC-type bacteriocin/lantibiotic exporter with double-glycine peptidase domain